MLIYIVNLIKVILKILVTKLMILRNVGNENEVIAYVQTGIINEVGTIIGVVDLIHFILIHIVSIE